MDAKAKKVIFDDGSSLKFDTVLLATGGMYEHKQNSHFILFYHLLIYFEQPNPTERSRKWTKRCTHSTQLHRLQGDRRGERSSNTQEGGHHRRIFYWHGGVFCLPFFSSFPLHFPSSLFAASSSYVFTHCRLLQH